MSDEIKKDEQIPEVKTEPYGESLPASELDKAVGGNVSLNFGKIEFKYIEQKSDGAVDPPTPASPPAK